MSQATGDETSMRINSTWNKATSGNMTALEINIIDTLSPGAGYFVRGMKAGVAQWYINESYKLYLPGAIDFSGPLTSFGALSIATLSNGNITLDPHGTGVIKADALITSNTAGPLNLGTAAVAGYATGTGDVLVGGKWEVDGILYADGGIQLANSQAIYNSSSGSLFAVLTTQTIDPFALMLRDNARYLLIGSYAHRNIDYGFPNPDNPTIVLPSADGGTPLSRIYMYHDGTSLDAGAGTIKTDAGDIHLDPASGLVTVDGAVKASYQSSDGTAGLDSSTDYWLCTASDCSTTCQLTIKDGLITGCP